MAFDVADVRALPYPDQSFSLVVSRFAFHHFERPGDVLAEMKRVCKRGGRVVVCDLLASDNPDKADAFHAVEMMRDPSHARALRLDELAALFVTAGLASSNGEARRHVQGGAVRVNDEPVSDDRRIVTEADLTADGVIKLSLGKKKHVLVRPA